MSSLGQKGLATVEFVIVASLIFLPLFLGVTTVGLRYYQHNTLTKAVNDAARYYGMKCVSEKHGTTLTKQAYRGALEIMAANVEALNISFDQSVSVVDSLADRTEISCWKYANGSLVEVASDALSCESECEYVQMRVPKTGKSFQFPFWTDTSTILAITPIMR